MNNLLKDTLAIAFLIALTLLFSNIWAVKSDQQAQAEHAKIVKHKQETGGK